MPTILFIMGWRFFFYANERNEPIHIHCQKAEMECKYWLGVENFTLEEAYSYNMSHKDEREVKKIIFEYFEFIESEWNRFQVEMKS
ncbi:MAG: hypothetical protein A2889_03910 [Nitrospinae bacterium RIFCSPLOWO2_01_FULL_39_10]|nr:MAG: hypothetical protein A2889_03910 [Nitrospinae bacterium RIFCSPLOWO2_01_FULL_39_10]